MPYHAHPMVLAFRSNWIRTSKVQRSLAKVEPHDSDTPHNVEADMARTILVVCLGVAAGILLAYWIWSHVSVN